MKCQEKKYILAFTPLAEIQRHILFFLCSPPREGYFFTY